MREIDPDKVAAQEAEVARAVAQGRQAGRRIGFGCLLAIPALFAITCVGGGIFYAYMALVADATLTVHNPGERAEVYVDDALVTTIDGQGRATLDLPRGQRDIRIEREGQRRQWSLDVTGFDDLLVSADPDVCFAQLNVSRALYGPRSSRTVNTGCGFDSGDVDLYMTCHDPCDIGMSTLSVDELPDEVEGTRTVTLMVPFRCDEEATLDPARLLGRQVGCVPIR